MEAEITNAENIIFLTCNICPRASCTCLPPFENHMKLHGSKILYKCRICRKSCSNYRFAKAHVKYRHRRHGKRIPDGLSKLGFFLNQFLKIMYLLKHATVKLKKGFKCGDCGLNFPRKESFILHFRRHLQEDNNFKALKNPYQIPNLFLSSVPKNSRGDNQMTHFLTQNSGIIKFVKEFDDEHPKNNVGCAGRPLSCPRCNLRFKTRLNLKCHQIVDHAKTTEYGFVNFMTTAKDTVENHLKCSKCVIQFPTFDSLWEHQQKIHHGKEMHMSNFRCENNVEKHNLRMFVGEKHSCPICSTVYEHKTSLKRHVAIHLKERPSYKCAAYCGKTFKSLRYFQSHLVQHGENGKRAVVKKYSCPTCPAEFANTVGLRSHMVIHSEERPYKCSVCDKSFKRANCLRIHMMIHDGNRNRFSCIRCSKVFVTKHGLQGHFKMYHTIS